MILMMTLMTITRSHDTLALVVYVIGGFAVQNGLGLDIALAIVLHCMIVVVDEVKKLERKDVDLALESTNTYTQNPYKKIEIKTNRIFQYLSNF